MYNIEQAMKLIKAASWKSVGWKAKIKKKQGLNRARKGLGIRDPEAEFRGVLGAWPPKSNFLQNLAIYFQFGTKQNIFQWLSEI